jgi:hypothetical protein
MSDNKNKLAGFLSVLAAVGTIFVAMIYPKISIVVSASALVLFGVWSFFFNTNRQQ